MASLADRLPASTLVLTAPSVMTRVDLLEAVPCPSLAVAIIDPDCAEYLLWGDDDPVMQPVTVWDGSIQLVAGAQAWRFYETVDRTVRPAAVLLDVDSAHRVRCSVTAAAGLLERPDPGADVPAIILDGTGRVVAGGDALVALKAPQVVLVIISEIDPAASSFMVMVPVTAS
jgi:hypothetical protein